MDTRVVLAVMGVFYLGTGLWPLLHYRSFIAVTGPKVDVWLVKTVGLLVTCSGIVFLMPWLRGVDVPLEVVVLACMNAGMLAAMDVYYSLRGTIRKVYLADAAVELGFVAVLVLSLG